jgi:hypothetical protein
MYGAMQIVINVTPYRTLGFKKLLPMNPQGAKTMHVYTIEDVLLI